ncbi:hypothetical protein J6590_027971 [Homalodisca vitripennis]|nr:hypothetical protein J6590_027971 [Homalodisca vitripennis]
MNVQNLKLQFSNPDSRPNNVVRTQIPVSRFSFGHRNSTPPSLASSTDNLMNGNSHHQHNSSTHSLYHHPQQHSPQHSPIYTSTTSLPVPLSPDKWRSKYEDAEKKRKTLLSQNQKSEVKEEGSFVMCWLLNITAPNKTISKCYTSIELNNRRVVVTQQLVHQ